MYILKTLFNEIISGKYDNFRRYLIQNNVTTLYYTEELEVFLLDFVYTGNLIHLGSALQNTSVTEIGLTSANIKSKDIIGFVQSLKGTQVQYIDLSSNE